MLSSVHHADLQATLHSLLGASKPARYRNHTLGRQIRCVTDDGSPPRDIDVCRRTLDVRALVRRRSL